jgi:hypothetical protein
MFEASPSIMILCDDFGDMQVVLSHELKTLPREEQRRLFRAFIEALREVRGRL